jgi:glycerophosphoryl diester phosphodiesterase
VEAAVEADYAVEVDLRLSADGGLVVIHDATLDRTTTGTGAVADRTLDELREIPLSGSDETLSSITDLLALVSGRAPLFLELKAPPAQENKARMAAAITRALAGYGGAAAVMTFDPDLLALLRRSLRDTPLGILAGGESQRASLVNRFGRDMLLHMPRTQPDFVAYHATALPHPAVRLARRKRPVLAWTVRSAREAASLAPHCDQIIFENFRA